MDKDVEEEKEENKFYADREEIAICSLLLIFHFFFFSRTTSLPPPPQLLHCTVLPRTPPHLFPQPHLHLLVLFLSFFHRLLQQYKDKIMKLLNRISIPYSYICHYSPSVAAAVRIWLTLVYGERQPINLWFALDEMIDGWRRCRSNVTTILFTSLSLSLRVYILSLYTVVQRGDQRWQGNNRKAQGSKMLQHYLLYAAVVPVFFFFSFLLVHTNPLREEVTW